MKICVATCHVLGFATAVLLVTFGILGLNHPQLFVGRFIEDACGKDVIDRVKPPNNPTTKIFYFDTNQDRLHIHDNLPIPLNEKGPYTFREEWFNIVSAPSDLMFNKRYSFSLNLSIGPCTDEVAPVNVRLMTLYHCLKNALNTRKNVVELASFAHWDFMYAERARSQIYQLLYTFNDPRTFNVTAKEAPLKPVPRYHYIGFFNSNESRDTFGFNVPTPLTKNSTVYLYHPDLCGPLLLVFEQELVLNGMPVLRFGLSPNMFVQNGLLNVTQWYPDVLMGISLPHFLNDEERIINYDGLQPVPAKHATFVDVEPHLGIVVQAKIRLQYNVFTSTYKKLHRNLISYYSNISIQSFEPLDVLMPYCWVEWGFEEIPQTAAMKQWLDCNNQVRKIMAAISYTCLAMGVLVCAITLGILLMSQKN